MKLNKRKIIFLPTYDYLSEPLFLSFVDKLQEYETIYINHDEFSKIKKKDYLLTKFNRYIEINGFNNDFKTDRLLVSKFNKIFIKNYLFQKKILKIVKEIRPNLLITTSDMSISFKGIKNFLYKNKIPIIIIQPSFFDYKNNIFKIKYIFYKFINLFIELYPKQSLWGNEDKYTILFIWGKYFLQFYNKNKDVRIVGNPVYDKYKKINMSQCTKSKLKGLVKNYKYVITICTEAFGNMISEEAHIKLFEFYTKIINDNKSIYFIIKLHPREDLYYIKSRMHLFFNNYKFITNQYALEDILLISDIQISVASTTSLQSLLLKKPIILVNPNNLIKINNFFDNDINIELRVKTIEEFNKAIYTIFFNVKWRQEFYQKRNQFINLYLNSIGCSADKIKKEIDSILEREKDYK